MPQLSVLVACEKVIVDRVGVPSLISIFQRMNVQLQMPEQPPHNATIPITWAVFVLWQHSEDELDKEFIQRVEVDAPDGKNFISAETKFKITDVDDRQSKNHIIINGLPVWAEGFVTVKVWLEGVEGSSHTYLFFLKFVPSNGEKSIGESKPDPSGGSFGDR
jgi:hypothetical protein